MQAQSIADSKQAEPQFGPAASKTDIFARIRAGKNVRVAALADAIGMSRGGLYGAIEAGDVEAVKIGRAVLVPARVAARLLGIEPGPIAA